MSDSPTTSGSSEVLSVAADPSRIGELRRRIVEAAPRLGAVDDVVRDLELAVSELATNVIQHTEAPEVEVTLRREPGRLVLEVADADGITDVDPNLPDPTATTGRGLFIVNAVMDDVQVIDADGGRRLRCVKLVS